MEAPCALGLPHSPYAIISWLLALFVCTIQVGYTLEETVCACVRSCRRKPGCALGLRHSHAHMPLFLVVCIVVVCTIQVGITLQGTVLRVCEEV